MTILLAVLVIIAIVLLIVLLTRNPHAKLLQIEAQLSSFEKNQERTERALKEEIAKNREETASNSKQLREEIVNSMTNIANLQKDQLDIFSKQLTALTSSNEDKLGKMRETIETKLKLIQDDNSEKLEKMRITVDEKLHATLEKRLGESFKLVSERLEQVHKGLGEMQNLAVGVGDLKKVLSNVKTRGILGEIQLGNILEQILTPEQYSKNVATKKGSRENVEFAIKLPGKDDSGEVVYLPLDSKFPIENYHALHNAYEHGEPVAIEEAAKLLEGNIKKCAKDIRDKYIDPPNTTDFGILFLPVEGLYAEVVRRPALLEILQRDYKIMIAGPTTLSAFLNSLQMGFRTLVIEKRSSEVWNILGAVKTEFEEFGNVLKKAQKKIKEADDEIDKLVGVRTRQIQRKLKDVQELPAQESLLNLPGEILDNDEAENDGNNQ
ncbi:MAG: DNA recombination protein RmuC [Nitrospirota bacterium]